jgi:methyl-accepting chemotaxis protein
MVLKMSSPSFGDRSIAFKLNAVLTIVILVILSLAGIFLSSWLNGRLEERSLAELQRTNQQVVDMIDAYAQVLERSAAMLGAQFAGPLPKGISGDAAQANQAVEAFTHSTGAVATVFARQGDNFVRIATTLKNDKGERTVGTSLVTTHPAFSLIKSGKTYTGPATLFGQEYMTHYTPLLDAAGQVQGIAFIGINFTEGLAALKKKVVGIKVGDTGYPFALDAVKEPGKVMIHPAAEGKNLIEAKDASGRLFVKEMLGMKDGVIRYPWMNKELGDAAPREKITVVTRFEKWGWTIGSGSYIDEFTRDARTTLIMLGVAGLVMALVVISAIYASVRFWVAAPLRNALQVAQTVAAGDLTASVTSDSRDEVGQLLDAIDQMCRQLRTMIGEVNRGIATLATGANKLSSSSQEVAASSGQQSDAAASMAAAVEEMTSSIDSVSRHAQDARQMAETSGRISQSGASVIGSAIQEMGNIAGTVRASSEAVAQLGNQSQQIASIVNVIREIADQTNLLALNAAIEAARAGEQGRGFAVVADEVRKLAERTTQSTLEIAGMVGQIQAGANNAVSSMDVGVSQVEAGVNLASQAGDSIAQIKDGAGRVDAAVISISDALREQTAASQDIARNVEQIACQAENNHNQALATSTAAAELENLARQLRQSIARFKT